MGIEHEHLAECERHIAIFRQKIAEQKVRVFELDRDGHDTSDALELLNAFEDTLRLGEEHRRMLIEEITRRINRVEEQHLYSGSPRLLGPV